MSKIFPLIFLSFLVGSLFIGLTRVHGDELDDINKQIADLTNALNQSKAATTPLEDQVASIRGRIAFIENDVVTKEKNIKKGYEDLEKQTDELNLAIRNYYIKSYYNSPILIFLSGNDASTITQVLAFQKATADQDKEIITNIALTINDLEKKKKALEGEKIKLASVKANLDKVIGEAKNYQTNLTGKIASLTAKQQEIMAARSGNFTFNIGGGELADEYLSSIKGFRESAPGGYFAIFSFGAYTHRNGMSQYGALGHVKNQGWNYEQLLKYYYPGVQLEKKDNNNIIVNGTNTYGQTFDNESYPLEEYLKHIYEVPSSWPAEILKAQAIAARSYAYGKSTICPGQGCQEFKREENAESWKQAVKDTEGIIMTGGPGNWQYSSTTGGWINGLGWDTTDNQGGSSFVDKSFEKIAGSPWVYKAWWRKGTSNNGDTCGRSNPWLSPQELADIVNAFIAFRDSGGIDTGRITPVTTSCWGGNPYSMDELRNLVAGKGGISSATSVSVSQGNNGITNNVTVNGVSMSGLDFKRAVCLRAPGFIRIPQSDCEGGWTFFNIEKK